MRSEVSMGERVRPWWMPCPGNPDEYPSHNSSVHHLEIMQRIHLRILNRWWRERQCQEDFPPKFCASNVCLNTVTIFENHYAVTLATIFENHNALMLLATSNLWALLWSSPCQVHWRTIGWMMVGQLLSNQLWCGVGLSCCWWFDQRRRGNCETFRSFDQRALLCGENPKPCCCCWFAV